MINVDEVLEKPWRMRALTSLTVDEFRTLLPTFTQVWQEAGQTTHDGKPRQRAPGGGRTSELPRPEDKLFFLLFYFKVYPTQEVMGALFGLSQGSANKWILRLTPLLHEALRRHKALPRRDLQGVGIALARQPGWRLIADGTDRPVRRPQDPEKQKDRYSGRKKRHTVKNVVLTQERQVRYLSPTVGGRQADVTLAQPLEQTAMPKNRAVITDTGFQGLQIQGALLVQPEKKKRGQPRTEGSRHWNRLVAKLRVQVEHVLAGVKRCRIVTDLFRHMKVGFEDLVMAIACALHNFREMCRAPLRNTS